MFDEKRIRTGTDNTSEETTAKTDFIPVDNPSVQVLI